MIDFNLDGDRITLVRRLQASAPRVSLSCDEGLRFDGVLISRSMGSDHTTSSRQEWQKKRCGDTGVATAHGFRSSLRDWASEHGYARDPAERSLAHTVANKVEAAYHRVDLLEQRRPLMEAWAKHVLGE
ncbi:hypothetical protein [Caballeronia sp. RCC_10]|uniref:hypothetical protein n=1 Tax=Caballeronia sp. RCC_10 TaxID=3239227 RepID=UPI003526B696